MVADYLPPTMPARLPWGSHRRLLACRSPESHRRRRKASREAVGRHAPLPAFPARLASGSHVGARWWRNVAAAFSSVKVGSFAGGSGVRRATMRTRPATCDGAGGSAVCIAASAAGGFSGTVTWRAGAERIVPNPSRPMRMPEVGRAFPVGSASTTSTLNGFGGSGDDRPPLL